MGFQKLPAWRRCSFYCSHSSTSSFSKGESVGSARTFHDSPLKTPCHPKYWTRLKSWRTGEHSPFTNPSSRKQHTSSFHSMSDKCSMQSWLKSMCSAVSIRTFSS
eukprot:Rmarinus@m.26908